MIAIDGALACLGIRHRDAGCRRESAQLLGGFRVDGAATGNHERALGVANEFRAALQRCLINRGTANVPNALVEHLHGEIEGFGLNILRHGHDNGTGIRRIGQRAHRLHEGGKQLLGAVDAIEEGRYGAESIVTCGIERLRILNLLENGIRVARGELIGGEEEDGHAVGGGQCGTGYHVERARANRRRAHVGLQAVLGLGVSGRGVDLALLIAGHDVGHFAAIGLRVQFVLEEGLTEAGHVAVTEDAEGSGDEALLHAVALRVLVNEEANRCLRHRQADGGNRGCAHSFS